MKMTLDELTGRIQNFKEPKSVCRCGHLGDGEWSPHEDQIHGGYTLAQGHGRCRSCACDKFTWVRWIPKFAELVDLRKEAMDAIQRTSS